MNSRRMLPFAGLVVLLLAGGCKAKPTLPTDPTEPGTPKPPSSAFHAVAAPVLTV